MSKFDELKKLDELLKDGVLSQEEFDKQKAKVLGTNKSSKQDIENDSSKESPKVVEDIKEEIKTGKNAKLYGFLAFLVLIVASSLFGSDNNTSPSLVQEQPQANSQTSRCNKVSQSFLNELAGNDGFDLRNGYAVNSTDFTNSWSFVSAEAYNSGGLGIDGKILSWFVDQYPNASYIEGVGAFGEEYSTWGKAGQNQSSPYDDGYFASRDCVK
jgi:hypothetical protein